MNIRHATLDDLPRLVEMGQRFQAETVYAKHTAWDTAQMIDTATRLITQDTGLVLVSECDGHVIGMLGAVLFKHHMTALLTVAELFFWVEPEHRGHGVRFMKRAEQWAREHGAVALQMIAPMPDVEKLYRRLGYAAIEVSFEKTLTAPVTQDTGEAA